MMTRRRATQEETSSLSFLVDNRRSIGKAATAGTLRAAITRKAVDIPRRARVASIQTHLIQTVSKLRQSTPLANTLPQSTLLQKTNHLSTNHQNRHLQSTHQVIMRRMKVLAGNCFLLNEANLKAEAEEIGEL